MHGSPHKVFTTFISQAVEDLNLAPVSSRASSTNTSQVQISQMVAGQSLLSTQEAFCFLWFSLCLAFAPALLLPGMDLPLPSQLSMSQNFPSNQTFNPNQNYSSFARDYSTTSFVQL